MPLNDSSVSQSIQQAKNGIREPLDLAQEGRNECWISIQSVVSGKESLRVGLDHKWLKNGVYCSPDEPGATRLGFSPAGFLPPGRTNKFKVTPGFHEIMVSTDFYASETLRIELQPGETRKLICGENFRGAQKIFYRTFYLFHREIPGKFYYFLRVVTESI